MVHKVCKKYQARAIRYGIEHDDLYSTAMIGLIKAYKGYDPTKFEGKVNKFSTYLVPTLEGELSRMLRDVNQGAKFSRRAKETGWKILKENLTDKQPSEVAEILEIDLDLVLDGIEYLRNSKTRSMDDVVYENDGDAITLQDQLPFSEDYSNIFVGEFLDTLDPRERFIIDCMTNRELSQREIGAELGVTQVHISRLLAKIRIKADKHFYGEPTVVEIKNKVKEEEPVEKKKRGPKSKYTEEQLEKVKELLAKGELINAKIAEETGVSLHTVVYYSRNKTKENEKKRKQRHKREARKKAEKNPLVEKIEFKEPIVVKEENLVEMKDKQEVLDKIRNIGVDSEFFIRQRLKNLSLDETMNEFATLLEIMNMAKAEKITFDITVMASRGEEIPD